MAQATVTLYATFEWWFYPYLYTLAFLCRVFNAQPNMERVARIVERAIRIKYR